MPFVSPANYLCRVAASIYQSRLDLCDTFIVFKRGLIPSLSYPYILDLFVVSPFSSISDSCSITLAIHKLEPSLSNTVMYQSIGD
ncbi:hypothetical protein FKM82_001740 [Ascaphus truei]